MSTRNAVILFVAILVYIAGRTGSQDHIDDNYPPDPNDKETPELRRLLKCRTELQSLCSYRFQNFKVSRFSYNTTALLDDLRSHRVYCKEDESGMVCFYSRYPDPGDAEWFRCYLWNATYAVAQYKGRYPKLLMEYKGICQTIETFKEVAKHNPAEPLDRYDWDKEGLTALHECYKDFTSACKARYADRKLKPKPFKNSYPTYLHDIPVTATCEENTSGLKCTANGELWFKCIPVRKNEAYFTYLNDTHQSASEFDGICIAFEIFDHMTSAADSSRDYKQDEPGGVDALFSYLMFGLSS